MLRKKIWEKNFDKLAIYLIVLQSFFFSSEKDYSVCNWTLRQKGNFIPGEFGDK